MAMNSSRDRSLHEKIARQKKFEQAQFQTMMEVYDHYRSGTFLSLDIVGSTKLKENEDGVVVVDSFKAFHSFVLERIRRSVSNVFSGDGVMCLFREPQEALDAAMAILKELDAFNRNQSRLSRYLTVRIGINTGTILFEDAKELGTYTERTIDIAGHLQKYAEPGQLLISKSTWEKISPREDFKRRFFKIDKTAVYALNRNFSRLGVRTQRVGKKKFEWRVVAWSMGFTFRRLRFLLHGVLVKLILAAVLALAGLTVYFNNIWNGTTWPKLDRSWTGMRGAVVDDRVWYKESWHHLGTTRIKRGDSWKFLPKTVYLVIPRGKNSKNNHWDGIREMAVIPLKRALDNRYRKMWWHTGLYLQYVETYSGYYIFTEKSVAEDFVRSRQ